MSDMVVVGGNLDGCGGCLYFLSAIFCGVWVAFLSRSTDLPLSSSCRVHRNNQMCITWNEQAG
ncbi:hypothetical protein HanXRQr2_Chr04g0153501 [Helianthus annuus]|uniref:Uncharacterized protein n=1 Tax=Helianthus annuus TaxID=4232 RepID=A0A251V0Z5_HELAN|nr:hypothetical protein HanXRQr2_Chr04g0153501 [Helianthus annuus]